MWLEYLLLEKRMVFKALEQDADRRSNFYLTLVPIEEIESSSKADE